MRDLSVAANCTKIQSIVDQLENLSSENKILDKNMSFTLSMDSHPI